MNIKQEIANKLSVLIKDNDFLKKYSSKDHFIAEIFKDFPFLKEEIVKITKELEEKVLSTLSEGVLYNSEGYEKIGKITPDAWTVCVFNGKAKKDDTEITIDTSFNTIIVEQDKYKNIIKISGIK